LALSPAAWRLGPHPALSASPTGIFAEPLADPAHGVDRTSPPYTKGLSSGGSPEFLLPSNSFSLSHFQIHFNFNLTWTVLPCQPNF
jgi:hypothetical protein